MNWLWLLNTGNYPATNYVNKSMILVVLIIAMYGITSIAYRVAGRDKTRKP